MAQVIKPSTQAIIESRGFLICNRVRLSATAELRVAFHEVAFNIATKMVSRIDGAENIRFRVSKLFHVSNIMMNLCLLYRPCPCQRATIDICSTISPEQSMGEWRIAAVDRGVARNMTCVLLI